MNKKITSTHETSVIQNNNSWDMFTEKESIVHSTR